MLVQVFRESVAVLQSPDLQPPADGEVLLHGNRDAAYAGRQTWRLRGRFFRNSGALPDHCRRSRREGRMAPCARDLPLERDQGRKGNAPLPGRRGSRFGGQLRLCLDGEPAAPAVDGFFRRLQRREQVRRVHGTARRSPRLGRHPLRRLRGGRLQERRRLREFRDGRRCHFRALRRDDPGGQAAPFGYGFRRCGRNGFAIGDDRRRGRGDNHGDGDACLRVLRIPLMGRRLPGA